MLFSLHFHNIFMRHGLVGMQNRSNGRVPSCCSRFKPPCRLACEIKPLSLGQTHSLAVYQSIPHLYCSLFDFKSISLYIGAPRSRTCCSQSDLIPNGFSSSHPLFIVVSCACEIESFPLPYLRNCSFILTATASTSDCRNT